MLKVQAFNFLEYMQNSFIALIKKKNLAKKVATTHRFTHQRCQAFIVNNPVFLFS